MKSNEILKEAEGTSLAQLLWNRYKTAKGNKPGNVLPMVAGAAQQNWNTQQARFARAASMRGDEGELDTDTYADGLKRYIEEVLLNSKIDNLEPKVQDAVDTAIDWIVGHRDNDKEAKRGWELLARASMSPSADPIRKSNQYTELLGQVKGQTVNSTGNPTVDNLLKAAGVTVNATQ